MAIGSGWVGSSAVSTTGQRWMSAAGSKVKVGTPFWMSSLVGKAMQDFTVVVGRNTYAFRAQISNGQFIQGTSSYGGFSNNSVQTGAIAATVVSGAQQPLSINATGSVSGTLLGCAITHVSQVQNATTMYIGLTNGPNQNFTLSFGGTNFTFTPSHFAYNTRHYRASTAGGWLYNQNGKTIAVTKI
ncbi:MULTISPECIES: hypothetical protein [Enterobacteriaceae]|uniref:hypothetical protein n=1 Tax=Enterobacteriaceae TaxID=543 RepID=UPI000735C796|nr:MULTISPECIES: hypothetical protein [Enterobacteriaceae]EAA1243024.1 hypothetical protein [Salmonella enterica subsp. enterica serovar Mbandaka]EBS2684491.1 hypothetical protein [Salmonella enterica subsp. enterica serovar Montevideo]EDM4432432.1 hypothetical protein [Salmonella enterica subsp. enterica serovar Infantis]HED0044551.1 hypothetical protein [Salmonella enterica subsp. enterica serovar Kentucky]HED5611247.1 hypothetical protein [Enterobacter kobei]